MCKDHEIKYASDKIPEGNPETVFSDLLDRGIRYAGLNLSELKAAASEDDEAPGGEEFIPEEIILASVLGSAFYSVGKEAKKTILEILDKEGAGGIGHAVDSVKNLTAEAFDNNANTEKRVTTQLTRTIKKGSLYGANNAELVLGLHESETILADMVKNTKYFTNTYFNDHVAPALVRIVEKILKNGDDVDAKAYKAVRLAMEKRLKNVPYWRVVANAAASRGFHYGAVKAGMVSGELAYEIVAVLDKKTSKICRHMNGKQFWLADAEVQVVKAAKAEGDQIKFAAPWLKEKDVTDKTANELRMAGFMVPPFHGNCRSTIKFVR